MQYSINQRKAKEKRKQLEAEFDFHLESAKTAGFEENWERFGFHMFKAGKAAAFIEGTSTDCACDEVLSHHCSPIARIAR